MPEIQEVPWKPRFNPWLIALTVTLATFMEVLDTAIANVSLPHIAGSLSVSLSPAAATRFTVAEAISDLPKRVSLDDGPLPYPKLRRRTPSDFQRGWIWKVR